MEIQVGQRRGEGGVMDESLQAHSGHIARIASHCQAAWPVQAALLPPFLDYLRCAGSGLARSELASSLTQHHQTNTTQIQITNTVLAGVFVK